MAETTGEPAPLVSDDTRMSTAESTVESITTENAAESTKQSISSRKFNREQSANVLFQCRFR